MRSRRLSEPSFAFLLNVPALLAIVRAAEFRAPLQVPLVFTGLRVGLVVVLGISVALLLNGLLAGPRLLPGYRGWLSRRAAVAASSPAASAARRAVAFGVDDEEPAPDDQGGA